VDLESPVSKVRAMTVDLGVSGFSTILAKAPPAVVDAERAKLARLREELGQL